MEKNSIQIKKGISNQLTKIQKKLKKLNQFDEFSLFQPNTTSVHNFDFFATHIEDKAKAYDSLHFIINKIKKDSQVDDHNPANDSEELGNQGNVALPQNIGFFNKQGVHMYKSSLEVHLTTFEKIQFKLKQIFGLVEDYLDQISPDIYQECLNEIIDPNLKNLKKMITSEETSNPEKVRKIEEEFKKIQKTLRKKFHSEAKNLLKTAKINQIDNRLTKQLAQTRDKSIMVIEPKPEKSANKASSQPKIELERIKINIQTATDSSNLISPSSLSTDIFIGFKDPTSYLTAQGRHGITIKNNNQTVHSKELTNAMKYLGEVVYCRGAYYIYNHAPERILRKAEDSSELVVWWDEQEIQHVWDYTHIIRVNREESALIVNLNETELGVIEVKEDGSAGRELMIVNETGARINCHDALSSAKVLAVNKKGLLTVYKADYVTFTGAKEVASCQIALKSDRGENQFWLAVCEKSNICAIQVSVTSKASRILIYQLLDENGRDRMAVQSELDIYEQSLSYLDNGCFSPYIGDNLILCAYAESDKTAYAYGYDLASKELTQVHSRGLSRGGYCWKLARVNNQVCGILSEGGVVLRFKFEVISFLAI